MLLLKGCGSLGGLELLCDTLGAGVGCDVIAQFFVGLHATFEVFHHRQCVVILGFQFGDALVQGVLVGQALFLQKIHGLCHNFEIVFREPTFIADALALGHPRLDVDQFPDGILFELHLRFAFGVCLQRG